MFIRIIFFSIILLWPHLSPSMAQQPARVSRHITLKNIPEPSDIVFDSGSHHLFIVSDNGILFQTSADGAIIRQAFTQGQDFEGVELYNNSVYVSDEAGRKVYQYSRTSLDLQHIYSVRFGGAINKAFESITYNATTHRFLLVAQEPATIVEYDDKFREIARQRFPYARDISSARWYRGFLYLLSNKDHCIFRCHPETFRPLEKFNVDVLNPEGIAFDDKGNVLITSDATQRLYFFNSITHDR